MSLLPESYTAAEVAALCGTTTKNISNWTDRGLIHTASAADPGRGRSRDYSWFTLMQTACAVAIMDLGVSSPQDAFQAAAHFAHIGKGQSGWVGEAPANQAVRWPGLPFHHMRGITMLYIAGNEAAILLHRIWNKEPFADSYFKLRDQLHGARSHISLDVTEIFKAICGRLGLDFRVVLDDAYRGHDSAVNWRQPGEGA